MILKDEFEERDEFLEYQRQKILIEVMLDIREILQGLIKNLGNK